MPALITPYFPAPVAHAAARLGAIVTRFMRRLTASWHRRNDVAVLASFDDVLLKDLGLTRGDVNDALAEPLWRDPTAVLVRRQHERRRARSTAAIRRLAGRAAPSPSLVPDDEVFGHRRSDPPVWLTW